MAQTLHLESRANAHWPVTQVLMRWYAALTHRYALHEPEHVGPYAGSLLERRDWDHL